MYCKSHDHILRGRTFLAAALFVCIISVSILSGFFLLTHADHEHDNNGFNGSCATCAHIASAEQFLKQLSFAFCASGIAIAGLFAFTILIKAVGTGPVLFTLFQLKVKLNN